MSKQWLRQHWKLLLNLVTLVAMAFLIYATRQQLGDTFRNLAKVNAWALVLLVPIEALNYHAQAKLYQGLFELVGNKLSYKFLYRTALELNFVNHVFPSGGVTGMSYFTMRMRRGSEITGAKATLIQVMKLALVFLSFEIMIIFGLFALTVRGRINDLTVLVAASLSTLMIVATVLFVYIVGSQNRINHFFTVLTRGLNRVLQLIWREDPEKINIGRAKQVFNDFHENYQAIKANQQRLRQPFWYALLANITEVAAVYTVYIAFGHFVNLGAVILAYAVANFAGFISVLPGGVGIYEALMTAVMASAGVPASVSLPVVVMYRVLNTIIQIPPGYYLYQKALRNGDQLPGAPSAA